jgi:NADH dehydrogenase
VSARLSYDSLVLAMGSENNYFSNEALAQHTLGMKTLAEAMALRSHVHSCLELAARTDSVQRREWLTFVIAGGGPTGVEYAGALAEVACRGNLARLIRGSKDADPH